MKSPPHGVKLVMAAVCVMKEIKPDKINDPSGTGGKVRSMKKTFLVIKIYRKVLTNAFGFSVDSGLLGTIQETAWRHELLA